MNINALLQLSKSEQIEYVDFCGVKIAERPFAGDKFVLFRVDAFYVEVLHEMSSTNEIQFKLVTRVTMNETVIDPYLKFVDISTLVQLI